MPKGYILVKIIRKCLSCGKEAHTEEDLKGFVKDKRMRFGRRNRCNECWCKQVKKKLKHKKLAARELKFHRDMNSVDLALAYANFVTKEK